MAFAEGNQSNLCPANPVPSYMDVLITPSTNNAPSMAEVLVYELSPSFRKTSMPGALVYMLNLSNMTNVKVCYGVVNDHGAGTTPSAKFEYESDYVGCIDYRFIFCPFANSTNDPDPATRWMCLNNTGLDDYTINHDILPCSVTMPSTPLDNYTNRLPSHNELYLCKKQIRTFEGLCWPLMLIFGLLVGASFAVGKNPFGFFDFSSSRMGRGKQYTMKSQNMSFDALTYRYALSSAVSSAGKVVKAVKGGIAAKKVEKANKGAVDKPPLGKADQLKVDGLNTAVLKTMGFDDKSAKVLAKTMSQPITKAQLKELKQNARKEAMKGPDWNLFGALGKVAGKGVQGAVTLTRKGVAGAKAARVFKRENRGKVGKDDGTGTGKIFTKQDLKKGEKDARTEAMKPVNMAKAPTMLDNIKTRIAGAKAAREFKRENKDRVGKNFSETEKANAMALQLMPWMDSKTAAAIEKTMAQQPIFTKQDLKKGEKAARTEAMKPENMAKPKFASNAPAEPTLTGKLVIGDSKQTPQKVNADAPKQSDSKQPVVPQKQAVTSGSANVTSLMSASDLFALFHVIKYFKLSLTSKDQYAAANPNAPTKGFRRAYGP
ncbi:MAG: hypothetical protein NT051_05405 [Candidatus Micrarchaeota archaeon]|nr:hypothetical protein [Candidatus Micrarchaeota archaeon]